MSFATLGEMRLLVFARSAIVPMISEIETAQEACGIGGVVGNKGGLVVKLNVAYTSMAFVSCHLAAHSHKNEQRNGTPAGIGAEMCSGIGAETCSGHVPD